MSLESSPDYSNSNFPQRPPEFVPNLEAMRPAEQGTIKQLMLVIADKSEDDIGEGRARAANLNAPGNTADSVFVCQMSRGTDSELPDLIGLLSYAETFGNQNGICYFISSNGQVDGLRINKTITKYAAKDLSSMHVARAPKDVAEVVHLIAAVSREPDVTAIGQRPGYVSEQETQSLIEFLDPLKPTELPQRHLT